MWLLEGQPVPDHNTIARFRTDRLSDIAEGLFNQFVELLPGMGEIRLENLFVDGTKIEANANKYSFVWKKATMKSEAKLGEKITIFIDNINELYTYEF